MQVRKQQLELDMEQQTGSKYEKEYVLLEFQFPHLQMKQYQLIQRFL